MKRLLMATFADRSLALAARHRLRLDEAGKANCSTRLHEGDIDLQLAVELDGTSAQVYDERSVAGRFGVFFGAFLIVGFALDLAQVAGDIGLPMTMTLGSLGVFAGTLAVLFAEMRPLDSALREVGTELERGRVLLTVAADASHRDAVAAALQQHGGRTVFEA